MANWPPFKFLVLALATAVATLLLYPLLTEILAAILIAYLLRYPYQWLAPRIGARKSAFGLIVASTLLVVLPFVMLVSIALTGLETVADQLLEDGRPDVGVFERLFTEVMGPGFDLQASIEEYVRGGKGLELLEPVMETIGGVSEVFVSITLMVFISYYLLVKGPELLAWFDSKIPLAAAEKAELLDRADGLMYAVVVGNFIIAVADGLFVGVGLLLAGFSNVIFLTILAIFMAIIPVIGSMIIWGPAAVYLIATGDLLTGVLLLGYGLVVVGAVDNILRPLVGAQQSGLDPATFIVGVFAGVSVLGFIGLFFGPVFLAMAKNVFDVLEIDVDGRALDDKAAPDGE